MIHETNTHTHTQTPNTQMKENFYDAAFYMESSLHCENRTKTFEQTFKLLKPGTSKITQLNQHPSIRIERFTRTTYTHTQFMESH